MYLFLRQENGQAKAPDRSKNGDFHCCVFYLIIGNFFIHSQLPFIHRAFFSPVQPDQSITNPIALDMAHPFLDGQPIYSLDFSNLIRYRMFVQLRSTTIFCFVDATTFIAHHDDVL